MPQPWQTPVAYDINRLETGYQLECHRKTVLGISQPFLGRIGSDCEDIRSIYGISLGEVTKRAYL